MTRLMTSSIFLLIFLAMIIVGFVRFKKPESGWLLGIGFLGLAFSVFCFNIYLYNEVNHTHALSSDNIKRIDDLLTSRITIFMPAIILFVLFIIGMVFPSHRLANQYRSTGGIGGLLAFIFLAISVPSWVGSYILQDEAEIKANVHTIQQVLESYAVDHDGLYPERIETLLDEDYLTDFPQNPFASQPMENVPYGSPDFEGNFTYLPFSYNNEVREYYLIGYGHNSRPGQRLVNPAEDDHAIIIYSNEQDNPLRPDDVPLPTIQEAIKSPQAEN
jgi:hypothetical protein